LEVNLRRTEESAEGERRRGRERGWGKEELSTNNKKKRRERGKTVEEGRMSSSTRIRKD